MYRLLILVTLSLFSLKNQAQYKYLGKYSADGTPQYFAGRDIIPGTTLEKIKSALPESYPVPKYNPQYISSGYETDIRLVDSAAVYITFVGEGAGYKNTLGFYTYPLNMPLTKKPRAEDITIIFPNVSQLGSGGSLVPGDKVLLGNFPANTGIGFVLIADGWRSGMVTNGNWILYSNPAFNPEADTLLKQHNVVLFDSTLQQLILSFEDIRRDNSSCDQDFNDAIFYITANPFKAIQQSNYTPIETANKEITSGNTGGLESNGRLASKIALRSFKRDTKEIEVKTERNSQPLFVQSLLAISTNNGQGTVTKSLSSYFPVSGMTGAEIARVSTPSDLVNITNAREIFSLDYYLNNKRVAVGLASYTNDRVYDHSKVICDRLNGSEISDIRTIILNKCKIINTTLIRANGETEYALHFSIKKETGNYRLYSLWNIDAYPVGEYLNFQFWGSSMSEICSIAYDVLSSITSERPIINYSSETQIPNVFMKSGEYKNGKLYLTISNKIKAKSILFNTNVTRSEKATTELITKNISLTGEAEQKLEIETGFLFDAGISVAVPGETIEDHFYLADGAWGIDYQLQEASGIDFSVQPSHTAVTGEVLRMEREPVVKGNIKGVVNLFRNVRAGNLPLSVSEFNTISFELQSDKAVELVIVPDSLTDWDNRPRYTISPTNGTQKITVSLDKWKDKYGNTVRFNKIRNIVFSLKGNDMTYEPFILKVSNTIFAKQKINSIASGEKTEIKIYPNPVVHQTMIQVPENITKASVMIFDLTGRKHLQKDIMFSNGRYNLNAGNLTSGVYKIVVVSNQQILCGSMTVSK